MSRLFSNERWRVLFFLANASMLSGCGWWVPEFNLLAKIPDDFQETTGTSRIAPAKRDPQERLGKPEISLERRPTPENPLLGAVARLDHEKVTGRREYREFLLPNIILSSASDHPVAVTATLGPAGDAIQVIVPSGDFHVGLLPKFSMSWLAGMSSGGAVNADMVVEGRWSRLRSDDLSLKINYVVTPPFTFPQKHLNPLVISLLDTQARNLPEIGVIEKLDYLSWAELAYYELLPFSQGQQKNKPAVGGWISLRSVSKILSGKDPSSLELTMLWASMALRDNVPAWLAFVEDDVFLFLGGLPPDKKAFVLAPEIFIKTGTTGNFSKFLELSREAYIESILKGHAASFVDVKDRLFFFDLPEEKSEKDQGGKERGEKKIDNPFEGQSS